MSAPSLVASLIGRVPLQLEGCPILYIIKFTRYAIRGVAALFLHRQEVRLYGAVASASRLPGGPFISR